METAPLRKVLELTEKLEPERLPAIAKKMEARIYHTPMSKSDRGQLNNSIANVTEKVRDLENEKTKSASVFAAKIKEAKAEQTKLLLSKKTGLAEKVGMVYTVLDPENMQAAEYEADGTRIGTVRDMTHEEAQLQIV